LRSRLLWQGYAAAAFVLSVVYFCLRAGSDAQLVIYQLLGLAAPIAIVVGLRRYRPARYQHWLLFAAGLVLWVVGDAYMDSYLWFLGRQAPYPSAADLAYLGAYPLMIGGVLVLLRGWGRPRIGDLLDGAIIAIAAALVTAPVLLAPLIATASSAFQDTITIAYPVADLIMLIALVQLLFRARVPNFSLRCVMVGIVALLIADVVYSFLNLNGAYTSGMAVDAGWMANLRALGRRGPPPVDGRDALGPPAQTIRAVGVAGRDARHGAPGSAHRSHRGSGERRPRRRARALHPRRPDLARRRPLYPSPAPAERRRRLRSP